MCVCEGGGRAEQVCRREREQPGPDLLAVSWTSRWCRKMDLLNSKSRRKATCKEEVTGPGVAGNRKSGHCLDKP